MIQANQIKAEMSVVCSKDGQIGLVDHMEGKDTIKLKKDGKGDHHYFPLSWVKSVDGKIHLDRPGDQAKKEWSQNAPNASNASMSNASATTAPGTVAAASVSGTGSADKSASPPAKL